MTLTTIMALLLMVSYCIILLAKSKVDRVTLTVTTTMVLVLMVIYYIILLAKSMVGRSDTNNDNGLSLDGKLLYNIVS